MNKYKASCCKQVRCEQVFIYHNLYCTVHGIRAVLDILLHTRTSTVVYIQFNSNCFNMIWWLKNVNKVCVLSNKIINIYSWNTVCTKSEKFPNYFEVADSNLYIR